MYKPRDTLTFTFGWETTLRECKVILGIWIPSADVICIRGRSMGIYSVHAPRLLASSESPWTRLVATLWLMVSCRTLLLLLVKQLKVGLPEKKGGCCVTAFPYVYLQEGIKIVTQHICNNISWVHPFFTLYRWEVHVVILCPSRQVAVSFNSQYRR